MSIEIREEKLYVDGNHVDLIGFRFEKELGRGANASTYLVTNDLLQRQEVVKIWFETNEDGRQLDENKFLGEITKNANLHIKNTSEIYTGGCQPGLHWCSMQYIEGKTLKLRLKDNPSFHIRYLWTESILNTMSEVYEKGFYHGDLHHQNIIIEENSSEPYIIDFGTSIMSGKKESHKRDARLLYKLTYEILPEMEKIKFITEKLKNEPSKAVCAILQYAIQIVWNIIEYEREGFDDYGIIERLVLPIVVFQDICEENGAKYVLQENLIDQYFEILNLDRNRYMYILETAYE